MYKKILLTTALAAVLAAGAAQAQSTAPAGDPPAQATPSDTAVNPPGAAAPAAPGSSDAAPPPAGPPAPAAADPTVAPAAAGPPERASADSLGDPASLKAGDPSVVSNTPIPDTSANRAKYRPLSAMGRHSSAHGK